ncbi:MAG TPA: FapA family protein [Clostridia bacterium]|nr:FapA family protein [Clostridia bacterium]
MKESIVYSSEYISILERDDGFYIQSFKKGMSFEQFQNILHERKSIKITSVMTVRNAIINAPMPLEKFAEGMERIKIELADDDVRAYLTLDVGEELTGSGRAELFKEIMLKLKEMGITYGIKNEVLLSGLENKKRLLVAEGITPVNGTDSMVSMFELKEVKPEAKEDGNVDHYELNLINRVTEGEWLGERTDPTEGRPGKTVKGSTLLPVKGRLLPLIYDKNTVREVYEGGVTRLYSRIPGAVHYDGERISVSNHLEITGNIDYRTGNINFDGFLTVKGTIEDSFSVTATQDIEILGDYGVGGVKDITSNDGSIFIKGGIAGNNKAIIYSRKNIYTKFVSDTNIVCEGSVHIGFYCLNSNIKAREVILDSPKGQIIGGNIEAEFRVVSSIIGSSSEKRTCITVKGFDRQLLKQAFDNTSANIEALKAELAKAKLEVSVYGGASGLSREQLAEYDRIKDNYYELRDRLRRAEEERKALSQYLRTRGEGEISVLKKVYPNTLFSIKKKLKEISVPTMSTSFCIVDDQIKEI